MTDQVSVGARAAASRLAQQYGQSLRAQVEVALQVPESNGRPIKYTDPVSLGGLIVGIATFTWTVYRDLRKETPTPASEVVARHVRVRLDQDSAQLGGDITPSDRDVLVQVTIEETLNVINDGDTGQADGR